jgi:hypothetical protein
MFMGSAEGEAGMGGDMNNEFYMTGFASGLQYGNLKGRVATGSKDGNESFRSGEKDGANMRYEIMKYMVGKGMQETALAVADKVAAKAIANPDYMAALVKGEFVF